MWSSKQVLPTRWRSLYCVRHDGKVDLLCGAFWEGWSCLYCLVIYDDMTHSFCDFFIYSIRANLLFAVVFICWFIITIVVVVIVVEEEDDDNDDDDIIIISIITSIIFYHFIIFYLFLLIYLFSQFLFYLYIYLFIFIDVFVCLFYLFM